MRVVVDHRLISTFTAGSSSGFWIAVMPWLPHPVLMSPLARSDTTFLVNGAHPAINSTAAAEPSIWYVPLTLTEWAEANVERDATAYKVDKVSVPYNSKSFRFVTIGAKVSYVGSTMENSGTLLVNDGSFDMTRPELNNYALNVFDGTNVVKTWDPNQVYTSSLNFEPNFDARSNSAYTGPARFGAFSLLVNQATDHPWQPLYEQLTFPMTIPRADTVTIACPGQSILTSTTVKTYPCIQGFDTNFAPKLINISGLKPGSTIQLELVYCVEYAIDSASSIVSLAKKPVPKPAQVQQVDALLQQQPPNQSLAGKIVETIGGAVTNVANHVVDRAADVFSPQQQQYPLTFYNRSRRQLPMIEEY